MALKILNISFTPQNIAIFSNLTKEDIVKCVDSELHNTANCYLLIPSLELISYLNKKKMAIKLLTFPL